MKALGWILVLGVGLSLVACGSDSDDGNGTTGGSTGGASGASNTGGGGTGGTTGGTGGGGAAGTAGSGGAAGTGGAETPCSGLNADALQWEDPPQQDPMPYASLVTYCDELDLDGHTDWRLPTLCELRSIVEGCKYSVIGGDCAAGGDCLSSDCWELTTCFHCASGDGPADGCYWKPELTGPCPLMAHYVTSDMVTDLEDAMWTVRFDFGQVANLPISSMNSQYVRCVRDK